MKAGLGALCAFSILFLVPGCGSSEVQVLEVAPVTPPPRPEKPKIPSRRRGGPPHGVSIPTQGRPANAPAAGK